MPRPKRKATEAAEVKAKKAKGETDLEFDLRWSNAGEEVKAGLHPLLLLDSNTEDGRTKAAGFDIDFTIIRPASGRKFATGATDWEWLYDNVAEKLKSLHEDGYRVLFFTNQAGIEKQKVRPRELMIKIEDLIRELGIPVYAFVSTAVSHYRKPSITMWEHFIEHCNKGKKVDTSECIYVGDAAGRAKNWAAGKPKDFSCSDRMFAANIGAKFYTPEEFFADEKPAPFQWGSINPVEFLQDAKSANKKPEYHSKSQEMVIMVAPPAAGKSTFCKRYLAPHGYVVVNRDTLRTPDKCIKAAREAIKEGKSVVIDNTNPAAHTRADYVQIAKKAGVPCRCFHLTTPLEMAHHLNLVRMNQTSGQTRRVPDVGYAVFKKNFEQPTVKEFFTEVKKIEFDPTFDKKSDEEFFKQWSC